MIGAEAIARCLYEAGVRTVFGLPGTQTVPLVAAITSAGIDFIVSSDEGKSAFTALGYAAVSGRPAVVLTIPGPGFLYALPGIAEAAADSIPILFISVEKLAHRPFELQVIDQLTMAQPITRAQFAIKNGADIAQTIASAISATQVAEPGPVYLSIHTTALSAQVPTLAVSAATSTHVDVPESLLRRVVSSRRPLLYVGSGALPAAEELAELVARLRPMVATTPSARGILPEDHPQVIAADPARYDLKELNTVAAQCDLVLTIGVRGSQTSSAGFSVTLPADRTIVVDSSPATLHGYQGATTWCGDALHFVRMLLQQCEKSPHQPERDTILPRLPLIPCDALLPSVRGVDVERWLSDAQALLPRDTRFVLDSGNHQMLGRRALKAFLPRGILFPVDFQSMGFAIPSALGVARADRTVPVVALVGDGSFQISALELARAVSGSIPITVIVFSDGAFGMIRDQQHRNYGTSAGVSLPALDLANFAQAIGADYSLASENPANTALLHEVGKPGVRIIELPLSDAYHARTMVLVRARAKAALRPVLRPFLDIIKRR